MAKTTNFRSKIKHFLPQKHQILHHLHPPSPLPQAAARALELAPIGAPLRAKALHASSLALAARQRYEEAAEQVGPRVWVEFFFRFGLFFFF